MKNYWTTAKGEKIPYEELEDAHLKNIIKDGYRNSNILLEAMRRGFEVPEREVDKLTTADLSKWLESFASVSLSGNEIGEMMMDLWRGNKSLFFLELNRFLERNKSKL